LLLALGSIEGDTIAFSINTNAVISGVLSYNYVDPYLYIMDYGYENPGTANQLKGAVINPASLALVDNAVAVASAGFGRTGGVEFNLKTTMPKVGKLTLPISLYAEETGGMYLAGVAVRVEGMVMGLAYLQGDRFIGDLNTRGELTFAARYSFKDTMRDMYIPVKDTFIQVPIRIELYGDGGGLLALKNHTKLSTTPYYFMFATEHKGVNYGLSFKVTHYDGLVDYTDTLTPLLRPSGANVYSESAEWDLGITASAVVEGGELYSNRYFTILNGNELGMIFGIQKRNKNFDWGVSVEQNMGASILRSANGYSTRGGLPRVLDIQTDKLQFDVDRRLISGKMKIVFGYNDWTKKKSESKELLNLPPRTTFRGGINARPGNWILDATITSSTTWGKGVSEVLLGSGFGYNFPVKLSTWKGKVYDWHIPLRFSQAIFYRVTKIEELPIYTIPALFFGVSTTLGWKGLQMDLSVRANTTTALFGNYSAAIDPDVPDLGIFNFLSAGAALSYGF